MNTSKHMIRHKGRDLTGDIKYCSYNRDTGKYDITFNNGKTYSYNYRSVEWLRDPEMPNPSHYKVFFPPVFSLFLSFSPLTH